MGIIPRAGVETFLRPIRPASCGLDRTGQDLSSDEQQHSLWIRHVDSTYISILLRQAAASGLACPYSLDENDLMRQKPCLGEDELSRCRVQSQLD